MDMSALVERVLASDFLDADWVYLVLIGMSLASMLVVLERILYFVLNRSDLAKLTSSINALLGGGEMSTFVDDLSGQKGIQARVLLGALKVRQKGPASVEEVMAGLIAQERLRMERGLTLLGTVGSNAPFLGLFGTVIGVMKAFQDLADIGSTEGPEVVMAGLSTALLTTAVGLVVAIPAVVAFNYINRRIKTVLSTTGSLSRLVIAHLKGA